MTRTPPRSCRRAGTTPASRPRSTPARSRSSTALTGRSPDAWKTEKAQNNMEAIIDKAVADGTKIDAILAENDSTATRRRGCAHGQELRLPTAQRPGRRRGQPANVAAGHPVRRRLEERQRARQGRRRGRARALQGHGHGQPDAPGRPRRSERRAGRRPDGAAVHDPWRQHRQLVHPSADAAHRREPELAVDGGWITKEKLCAEGHGDTAPAACQ